MRSAELGYRHADGFRDADEAMAFYREVATMVGGFAAEEVAPHAAEIDRAGVRFEAGEVLFPPRLAAMFASCGEMGLHGLTLPRELGGMNAPMLLYFINGELLARADASVMAHYGFHGGIAMAMLVLSMLEGTTELDAEDRARREDALARRDRGDRRRPRLGQHGHHRARRRQRHGGAARDRDARRRGQLDAHRPEDLHHLRPRQVPLRDRADRGSPTTSRRHGLDGLSMFLVRAYQDRPDGRRKRCVTIDRLEEKLGQHASATAALTFDGAPAELVGKPGEGFRQMLELMNHARLGVGFESIGLCEAALRMARAYAAERRSMGKTIDRHEMIADYFDEMETDILGLRALAMHAAFHEEVGHKKELFGALPAAAPTPRSSRARRAATARRRGARRRCSSTWPRRRRSRWRAAACRSTAATATCASTAPRSCCATRWSCRSTRAPARSRR